MSKWLNQLFEKKSKAKAADGNSEEQTNALLKGLITNRDATLKAASDQAPTDSAITMRARKEAEEEATRIIDHAKQGADEIRKRVTDTLLTVIDRAVTDAEQVSASIKTKAKAEAEAEAAKIIEDARKKAAGTKQTADGASQKEPEEILAALGIDELPGAETKQKLQLYLLKAREQIERDVREEYKQAQLRLLRSIVNEEPASPAQTEEAPATASASSAVKPTVKEENIGQAKIEAGLANSIDAKKKAEEEKQAEEAGKQAAQEVTLNAKVNDGRKTEAKQTGQLGNLSSKLSNLLNMKIGTKAEKTEEITETVKPAAETQLPIELKAMPAAEGASEDKIESPVPTETKAPQTEPARPVAKEPPQQQRPAGKKADEAESNFALQGLDTEAVYSGEIELAISVPVDPAAVTRLYNYLQSTPDMKIIYTRGSWERGTVITVALDKPMPFIGMISKIPGLQMGPGLPQKDNVIKGSSSSLLGAKRKDVTKIDLRLKTE